MRRKHLKQRNIIIISVIGIICFFSVGYAAFGSNFLVSGKGTILKSPIAPDEFAKKIVTSGDGLYKDPVDSNRLIYRGANPNNYIELEGDVYRIVSIESDRSIKVVKHETIGTFPYDLGYNSAVDGITTANSVAGTRYSGGKTDYCYNDAMGTGESGYAGCNVWGSKTTMLDSNENNVTAIPYDVNSDTAYNLPNSEAYLNMYLNDNFFSSLSENLKTNIINHVFNVGVLSRAEGQLLETDVAQEKEYKWIGKVGLINITDYIKASINPVCTSAYSYYNNTSCYSDGALHNYMYTAIWTMTPRSNSYKYSFDVWNNYGDGRAHYNSTEIKYKVHPVFFLSQNVKLSGEGTINNMYKIE